MAGLKPPTDAGERAGDAFRRRLGSGPGTLATLAAAIAGSLPGMIRGDAGLAGLGALIGVAVVLAVVAHLARREAEQAFFAGYAVGRRMELSGRSRLPARTPLLKKGDDRYAERLLRGPLGDGVSGSLALYTYETESTDSRGNTSTSYHRYTVGLVEVPELRPLVSELLCQRRSGLRIFEGIEDAFRDAERVTLESRAFNDRYELFADRSQDPIWLRRLFSPGFVVWLAEDAPEGLAFEVSGGLLCVEFSGHMKSTAELDSVRSATARVARRLREEV